MKLSNALLHPPAKGMRGAPQKQFVPTMSRLDRDKCKTNGIVYSIINKDTGDVYIGATTTTLGRRFHTHRKGDGRTQLYKDMETYGARRFKVQHIATALDIEYLSELERLIFIQENPNYNMVVPYKNAFWGRSKSKEEREEACYES